METTVDDVRKLTDAQVVQVMEKLYATVYSEVSYDEVLRNSDAVPELGPLVSLDDEALGRELSAAESARLGRSVLLAYAEDSELAPIVQQAVDKVRSSDELVIGVILAAGLVVNLTLLVATTKVEIKKDESGKITWKIVKRVAKPELVKAVVNPVVSALTPGS